MMKTLAIGLLVTLFLSGCAITRSPGFYSGYKRLTPAQHAQIQFVPTNQPVPPQNGQLIYAVAARSLLQSMPNGTDTTLVYLWGPRCHSQECASLQSVQAICNQRNYRLYVVAEYYDIEQINLQPRLSNPILAINCRFYQTEYCDKYVRLFSGELRQGIQLADHARYGRYYLFKGNRFVKALNALVGASPQFPSFQPARLPSK